MKAEKKCLDTCPKCDSQNILWGLREMQDDYVSHDGECQDCKLKFTEFYNIVYDLTEYDGGITKN